MQLTSNDDLVIKMRVDGKNNHNRTAPIEL